jgi:hypothetical protein
MCRGAAEPSGSRTRSGPAGVRILRSVSMGLRPLSVPTHAARLNSTGEVASDHQVGILSVLPKDIEHLANRLRAIESAD